MSNEVIRYTDTDGVEKYCYWNHDLGPVAWDMDRDEMIEYLFEREMADYGDLLRRRCVQRLDRADSERRTSFMLGGGFTDESELHIDDGFITGAQLGSFLASYDEDTEEFTMPITPIDYEEGDDQ